MVRRLAPTIAAAAVLAAGCATRPPPSGGYQAPIRLQVPELVAWEPDGPFDLKLVVFNGTGMQIQIVGMKEEAAQVTLFRADGSVACKMPNPAKKTYEIWWIRKLNAGTGMDLQLDVRQYCKDLQPGAYRFEVIYVANNAFGSMASLYQGIFGPEKGRVLVRAGATQLKFEELSAALGEKTPEPEAAPAPAEPATPVAPPATAPAVAEPEKPAAEPKPASAAQDPEPALSPGEVRACVDRELASRGLNAYGDPAGTVYQDGAPVDEYGRVLYVASRYPAIRRACGIPRF